MTTIIGDVIMGVCEKLKDRFPPDEYDILTEKPRGLFDNKNTSYNKDTDKSEGKSKGRFIDKIKPCFYVRCKIPSYKAASEKQVVMRPLLGDRYILSVGVCVEYRPSGVRAAPSSLSVTSCAAKTASEVMGELIGLVEHIDTPSGVVTGGSIQGEISEDGVVSVFLRYPCFVRLEKSKDKDNDNPSDEMMEELERLELNARVYDEESEE